MNNYNGLGAIMAGINGTSIHRLAATRELVSAPVGRDFMKLEILMSSQKSYFAYRLAWENSSGERIPYLPLHRRDLVSAAEGNSTFVGDAPPPEPSISQGVHPGTAVFVGPGGNRSGGREAPPEGVGPRERINWRKFEITGDVIVGFQRAQGTPYGKIRRNDEVKRLILDVQFMKDDDVSVFPFLQRCAHALTHMNRTCMTEVCRLRHLPLATAAVSIGSIDDFPHY